MTNQTKQARPYHIALIIPAADELTPQYRIDNALSRMIANGNKKANGNIIHLHYMAGRIAADETIKKELQKYPNIKRIFHYPKYSNGMTPAQQFNTRKATAGRMIAEADALIVLKSPNSTPTKTDNFIVGKAQKSGYVKIRELRITPTDSEKRPIKASLKASHYRVDIRRFKSLADCTKQIRSVSIKEPIYCGRKSRKYNAPPSPLQNLYKSASTEQNIADFRSALWKKIKANDKTVMHLLRKIDHDTPLICYCEKSKKCHTDIIRFAAKWVKEEDQKIAAWNAKQRKTAKAKPAPKPPKTRQCKGETGKGKQCKNRQQAQYCHLHKDQENKTAK